MEMARGRPGAADTSWNKSRPSDASSFVLKSSPPLLEPPLITTISALCSALWSSSRSRSGTSLKIGKQLTAAPISRSMAGTIRLLESVVCPRWGWVPQGISSDPVGRKAIFGFFHTGTRKAPPMASSDKSIGRITVPASRRRSPSRNALPPGRTLSPADTVYPPFISPFISPVISPDFAPLFAPVIRIPPSGNFSKNSTGITAS